MLIALLTVDAVLKKSLLRSFQRRGNSFENSQASNSNSSIQLVPHQNLQLSPFKKFKVQVSSRFINNLAMSSTGHQITATGSGKLPSKTMTANNDNIINNTTIMYVFKNYNSLFMHIYYFHIRRSFKTGDKHCCQEIKSRNVKIIANPGTHDHGSSKVKLKNIVDYKWEVKNYPGHLIAVHIDEKHIAYAINGKMFEVFYIFLGKKPIGIFFS